MPVSLPLSHATLGNGVHFLFEGVSRPTFSGKYDPARRFLKKGPKYFSRGCSHFGVRNWFYSILWPIMVILVSIYMFQVMTNRLQQFSKFKMAAFCPKFQNGAQNDTFSPNYNMTLHTTNSSDFSVYLHVFGYKEYITVICQIPKNSKWPPKFNKIA